jgi:TetR/AcrR family fatty acid metabolism transcriptional regulator
MAKKRDDAGMQTRLMQAAMSAFGKKGLADCTMGDIAEEAGLAKGTAYLYFKGKEQLMVAMYKLYAGRMIENQRAQLAKARDLDARQLLDRACELCLESGVRHRRTFSLWFQFLALGTSGMGKTIRATLANNYREHSAYLEEIIERGKKAGEFRPEANSRAVAAALVSLLEGLMIRDYADPSLINLREDYLSTARLIQRGIWKA